MELRHLRYFVAVAEEMHFGRAAVRLHITQPPLSQQIRKLEEELDVLLFRRTKRRVELTEAGQLFLVEARRTLAQAEQAVRIAQRAHRGETGTLRIGLVGTAAYHILPHILRHFRAKFPDIALNLQEMVTQELVAALHSGEIDVGVVRSPVQSDQLTIEVILREPLVAALSTNHVLASRPSLAIKELAGESFVLIPRQMNANFYDQIVNVCQQAGFTPNVTQEAMQMQTILGLVAVEIGIAILPASVQVVTREDVVYRPLADVNVCLEVSLAWQENNQTAVLQNFLHIARQVSQLDSAFAKPKPKL